MDVDNGQTNCAACPVCGCEMEIVGGGYETTTAGRYGWIDYRCPKCGQARREEWRESMAADGKA